MDKVEVIKLVERLKRAFPRHRDIWDLCSYVEVWLSSPPVVREARKVTERAFEYADRREYLKLYMRNWRKRNKK